MAIQKNITSCQLLKIQGYPETLQSMSLRFVNLLNTIILKIG